VRARALLPLACAALLACASPPRDDAGAGAEAERTVAAFHAALARGDRAAAESLLAPDAVVLEGGERETREEYLAHHLDADVAFAREVPLARESPRAVARGDVAWVVATTRGEGAHAGRPLHIRGAELIVLSRGDDGWRIRAIHWSSRAASEPGEDR
jgi:ketosteroid isomerase-like protein